MSQKSQKYNGYKHIVGRCMINCTEWTWPAVLQNINFDIFLVNERSYEDMSIY